MRVRRMIALFFFSWARMHRLTERAAEAGVHLIS